jgi:hypothetical protein
VGISANNGSLISNCNKNYDKKIRIMVIYRKKGMEAAGFTIIVSIILLLISGGVILGIVKQSSGKVDEKLQIDLCRISNELRFGYNAKMPGPDIKADKGNLCNTIHKTEGASLVPTKKYPQTPDGARAEIREMIKNCWFEWLEGSEVNTFGGLNIIGSGGCHTCYVFKTKPFGEGVGFSDIRNSMDDTFFAADSSDQCSKLGGFQESCISFDSCERYEGIAKSQCETLNNEQQLINDWKEIQVGGESCCISKKSPNECENRGGICTKAVPSDGFSLYSKWSCPGLRSCYVPKEERYSYSRYITDSKRGGSVFFIDPGPGYAPGTSTNVIGTEISNPDQVNVNYASEDEYAISFVSPNRGLCHGTCRWVVGSVVIGGVVVGTAATGGAILAGTAPALLGTAGTVGGAVLKGAAITASTVGPAALIGGAGTAAVGIYGVQKTGLMGTIAGSLLNKISGPISDNPPSFLLVSSAEHAKIMGCTITYPD